MEVFLTTLEQVVILLLFIIIGFFLRKKNYVGENASKMLATLEMLIFMPASTFSALSSSVTVEKFTEYLMLFLYGCIFLVVAIALAMIFARLFSKDKEKRNIFTYALAFSNSGYFGYPVVEAVWGSEMLAMFIFFSIPFSIAINSFGMYILTKDYTPKNEALRENPPAEKPKKRNRLAFLYSPVMISTYLGIIVGLLPFTLPQVVNTAVSTAANCMSPVAMLLTGVVLATVPLKKLFGAPVPYLVGLIRLIVLPVLVGGVSYLLGLRGTTLILSTAMFSLPIGMNVVVFPESVGKDSPFGASICFISYILALIAIPLVFTAVMAIA